MQEPLRPRLSDLILLRGHSFFSSPLSSQSCVVDGGAHLCQFANAVAERFGAKVVALEANQALKPARIADGVTHVHAALADKSGTSHFRIDSNPEASSLVDDQSAKAQDSATIEVQLKSLPAIIEEHGLERIDLLKLDIEGAEYGVLSGLDSKLAEKIGQITVEFHPMQPVGEDLKRMLDVFAHLANLGFERYKASFSSFGDVLFVNRNVMGRAAAHTAAAIPLKRKLLEYRAS